ncbi:MAG: N-acetylglucosamine kinase [Reichenbachiella sp.]
MILVADSGSTKTEWRIIDQNGEITQIRSEGVNPNYLPHDQIQVIISNGLGENLKKPIDQIYFYGSGCGSEINQNIIRDIFNELYPNAVTQVGHDLLAAARALCGREPGIACILGTGSNSCLFDGREIIHNVQSLGYLLGDEGSGSWLGKKLLLAYFHGNLPEKIKRNFENRFAKEGVGIIQELYAAEVPVRYLAQFSKFIFQNIKDPFLYRLVYDAFLEFVNINIAPYKGYQELPISFTGSVAFYFGNILRQVGIDQGLHFKHIVEGPIAGLTLYHKKSQ